MRRTPRKIDQSISIVCETEQIADRRNSPLNSRARISDGSGIRFFVVSGKICLDRSMRYHASEQSSGRRAGRAAAVRAEFQRLGHSVSVATIDLHLSGITAERHAKAVAHDVSLSPMRRVLSSRSDRGRLERRNSQRSTGSSVGRSFPRGDGLSFLKYFLMHARI